MVFILPFVQASKDSRIFLDYPNMVYILPFVQPSKDSRIFCRLPDYIITYQILFVSSDLTNKMCLIPTVSVAKLNLDTIII